MLGLIILSATVAASSAQFTTQCECALFNSFQFADENPQSDIPLEYYGAFEVEETQCQRDPNLSNDCLILCQQQFATQGGLEADLCTRTNGQSPRCTGSKWCEAIYNSGIPNIFYGEGKNELYYRMVNCEGTPFTSWRYGFREITDDGLCCTNGRFQHCTSPCESACEANNLCECGAFVKSQFNDNLRNGTTPLPVYNVGTEFGPGGQFACNNWPGANFGHPCDNSCLTASQFFKNNRALEDPSPLNPYISLGDYYCQVLKTRWADLWPENGIGPEDLITFARMPGCDKNDGTNDHLQWNTARRYGCHHQALCCDGEGKRFQCEGNPLY